MPRITAQQAGGESVCVLLGMIAFSEIGKAMHNDPSTDNGYRVMVGWVPRLES